MFKALIGDLFRSSAQTLVNTVNCVGVMGKGVALEFKKRFPEMFEDYRTRCQDGNVQLGRPYLYRPMFGQMILNFPTKQDWRSVSRLADIEAGLDYFLRHYREWGIESIAFPPLGCGNGGLEWSTVGPLMYRKLNGLDINVEVFAPYGTPKQELSEGFLSQPLQSEFDERGRRGSRFNDEWVIIVEVLRSLNQQDYAPQVGRVIFQKICYVLTELGVDTGFSFGKGSYGPFADEVKNALHALSNRNWLMEKPLGRMILIQPTPQYEQERKRFSDRINHYDRKVSKTVDLFCRIKDTEQAEEMFTVLYASRELKSRKNGSELTEQELFDYIFEWKARWHDEEKKRSIADAIRSLVLLGWVRLKISESLQTCD